MVALEGRHANREEVARGVRKNLEGAVAPFRIQSDATQITSE